MFWNFCSITPSLCYLLLIRGDSSWCWISRPTDSRLIERLKKIIKSFLTPILFHSFASQRIPPKPLFHPLNADPLTTLPPSKVATLLVWNLSVYRSPWGILTPWPYPSIKHGPTHSSLHPTNSSSWPSKNSSAKGLLLDHYTTTRR